MMTFLSLLLLFGMSISYGNSTLSPTCIGASLSYSIRESPESQKVVYTVNFDLDLEVDSTNSMFPNKFTVSNQRYWSLDNSTYYLMYPIGYYQWNAPYGNCSYSDPCTFNAPNGKGRFSLSVYVNNSIGDDGSSLVFFSMNGNMYDSISSKLFDPHNYTCSAGVQGAINDRSNVSFCCRTFLYYEIPDENDNPCTEMQTSSRVVTPEGLTIFAFDAIHSLNTKTFDTSVTTFINNVDIYGYNYYIESQNGCYGDSDHPFSNCTFPFLSNNFQFDLKVDVGDYSNLIIGELIQRNGMWFKYDNVSYTPSDPCWGTSGKVVPDYQVADGSSLYSQFCCTAFKKGSSIVPPTFPSTTTSRPNYCDFSNVLFVGEMSKAITTQQKRDFYNLVIGLSQKENKTKNFAITTFGSVIYNPIMFQSYPDFINTVDSMIEKLPNPNSDRVFLAPILKDVLNLINLNPSKTATKILLMGELESIGDPAAANTVSKQIQETGAFISILDYSTGVVPSTIWQQLTNNIPGRIVNGTGTSGTWLPNEFNGWGYCYSG